jgi:hypothetical protein
MAAKIKAFDKQNLNAIRAGVNAALKTYGDSIGVTFAIGNIGFTAGEFHTKLTAQVDGAETNEERELKFYMDLYNLQANGAGGRTLVGYRSRAKNKFIFTKAGEAGRFVCDVEHAKLYFSKTA